MVGAFLYLQTGARGEALCRSKGFGGFHKLSLSHPGTTCFDEDFVRTYFNLTYLVVAPSILVAATLILLLCRPHARPRAVPGTQQASASGRHPRASGR